MWKKVGIVLLIAIWFAIASSIVLIKDYIYNLGIVDGYMLGVYDQRASSLPDHKYKLSKEERITDM